MKPLNTLTAHSGKGVCLQDVGGYMQVDRKGVRRLTPVECERLQGLPDDWTNVGISDTARYKMIGNGMAQPCADFVIEGIVRVMKKENESYEENA